jgi:uncharacterized membrane protein (DUF485 family)
MQPTTRSEQIAHLTRLRWRVALILTALMFLIYFGFMLLVAFAPGWLGGLIVPGLSRGILLAVLVILFAWVLTFAYVRWANSKYDPKVAEMKKGFPQS